MRRLHYIFYKIFLQRDMQQEPGAMLPRKKVLMTITMNSGLNQVPGKEKI